MIFCQVLFAFWSLNLTCSIYISPGLLFTYSFWEWFSVFLCLETYCLPWRGGRGTSCSQTYRWNIRIYWISQHYENWYQNILHSVVRLSDPERNSINKLHEISWSVSHKLLLHLISWYQVIRLCQISWRGEEYHVLRR